MFEKKEVYLPRTDESLDLCQASVMTLPPGRIQKEETGTAGGGKRVPTQ